MNKSIAKYIAAAIVITALIPVLCSCSIFMKPAVVEAAANFGDAVRFGDSAEIIRKTDGLDKEFKKEFKEILTVDNYTEEEKIYAAHMMSSIRFKVDDSSVKIKKDTATIDMSFTIADHVALQDADYRDIDELASAVDTGKGRIIKVTVEIARIEKEWYVTNFDAPEFKDLFSFLTYGMPVIGRSTLLETASAVAESVKQDDPNAALNIAASVKTPDMVDMPSYLSSIFSIEEDATEEKIAFCDAVRDTMTFEVDESTLQIDGQTGSVVIRITMVNYETLAGKEFKKVTDVTDAIRNCPDTITFSYTCELVRVGADWFVTNLDSDEFASFLSYKKFSISLKSIDGTYKASLDITDKFVSYVSKEFSIKMPSDLEGNIYISETLVLKNGQYEVTIDHDAFKKNIKTFVENNIDKIIMNMLGTTSPLGLDALAKVAGYADYADMRQQILNQVTENIESINTSGLESTGTFTINDNLVTFKSPTDTFTGTLDNYGDLTVISPVNDPDAKKLIGSDTVTLVFKKV